MADPHDDDLPAVLVDAGPHPGEPAGGRVGPPVIVSFTPSGDGHTAYVGNQVGLQRRQLERLGVSYRTMSGMSFDWWPA